MPLMPVRSPASTSETPIAHPGVGSAIIFYGETLCGIEQIPESGTLVLFGTQTTVEHNSPDCGFGPFLPILLSTETDEIFQAGDLLALYRSQSGNPQPLIEVYREQS